MQPGSFNYLSIIGNVNNYISIVIGGNVANNLISFIILAWCIFDYFKCNHISFNQITLVLIVVILIILPYSQKLKFFGIEFTRFKVPQRRKITENDNQTNKK